MTAQTDRDNSLTPTRTLAAVRADFPLLQRQVHGKTLVYLDNAATSQKPHQVIDAISHYYATSNANVHRGVHQLSDESTTLWEQSRATVAAFFAAQPDEVIVTRNTTEAINGVAYGWADRVLQPGSVILTTALEHHSNLVVWQEVCRRTGARLEFIPIDDQGRLDLVQLQILVARPEVALVALTYVSNTLGVELPVAQVVEIIRQTEKERARLAPSQETTHPEQSIQSQHANQPPRPIRILLDAAQAAPHKQIFFDALGVDFLVLSGHKMLGPMGIGLLLAKRSLLESGELRPWLFGGGMISEVSEQTTEFHPNLSERFTAGTPDVASMVGLAAACEYLTALGMSEVEAHDRDLVRYALDKLTQVPEVTLIGPLTPLPGSLQLDRLGSVAFIYQGVHAHDLAQVLDSEGVAVRSGHHCTMPLHLKMKWQATVRASFQVYTTRADIDALVTALAKVKKVFG